MPICMISTFLFTYLIYAVHACVVFTYLTSLAHAHMALGFGSQVVFFFPDNLYKFGTLYGPFTFTKWVDLHGYLVPIPMGLYLN